MKSLGIWWLLIGTAIARGQSLNPALQTAAQIQQKIAAERQVHSLTWQINQIQLQSIDSVDEDR